MDPMKQYGNIKENIENENRARRNYERRWATETTTTDILKKLYNQTELCDEIAKSGFKEECPYQYTRHGDSYFVSEDMYNSLMATCRCGRPKSKLHIIKCLQKVQDQYLDRSSSFGRDDGKITMTIGHSNPSSPRSRKVPETSGGIIGWLPNRYFEWEQSTRYPSPKYTMPCYKVDDHPYSHIFIG